MALNRRILREALAAGDAYARTLAGRIEDLLAGPAPVDPQGMPAIHGDDVSEPARLFQSALAGVTPPGAETRAVADLIAGWDAGLSPDSAAAACYSKLRWALARLVTERSGLGPLTAVFPHAPVVRFELGLLLISTAQPAKGLKQLRLAAAEAPHSSYAKAVHALLASIGKHGTK